MRTTATSFSLVLSVLFVALYCIGSLQAQTTLYTQNFNTFSTGTGISGNDGFACSTANTGPAANGTAGQTIGGITWQVSAHPDALPDECSFIKVVNAGGSRRFHLKNLRGLEGCFRLSGINITGYQAVVSLDLGIFTGTMEAGDSAIINIYVDGSLTPALTQRYGFASATSSFNTTFTSPGGSPFTGSTLDVEVCFRSGDLAPATTGAGETWYLDNIQVTGVACATVVNFDGETNPCVATSENYAIVSPPANHSFSWSLAGGPGVGSITPAMDGLSASVNWTGAGAKIVRVTAIDLSTGCISEHDYNITVRSGPVVTAIADLGPFCPGVNLPAISLSTTPVNNSVGFSWSGGAAIGIPDGSDNSFPFEIPAFTTENAGGTVLVPTISITATDNLYGCPGNPETFTVTVNPAPDLVLNGTPAVCSGGTFDLGTLIDMNLGNGEVVDQNSVGSLGFLVYSMQPYIPANQLINLMVTPSASKTYYFVKPTVGGCTDDLAVLLQVQGPVTVNSITPDEVICAGDEASFTVDATNAGDGALLYQWEVNTGMGWNPVSNGGIYSGATTATLTITDATTAEDGNQYRVQVSTSACPQQASADRDLSVKPRPALQTTINGVTVTDNYDGVDDTGSFTVCNSVPNNISINAFTDLNAVMPAGQVKVHQEVMLTNVAVPFCNGCVALLSTFTGAMGTATLVDPSMPGTLVLKFRAFYDDNNDNILDAGDCAGDWVIYTITVGNIPNVTATSALPFGGGIYATCSGEDFTINIDGTGNPVGTTYSADWSLSTLFGTPNLMLVSGTGDFANKPTTASTSTTLTGSFINPAPNVNSIQISLTITATTPDGCTNTYPMVIYLRPEISITGITGLPATVCSGEMTPVGNVGISLPGGDRSITWAWSGTDITATPSTGGPDNTDPFQVGATTLLNNSGDPRTATLTVTPNLTYATPAAQQCPGDDFEVMLSVEPGPLVSNQSATICSGAPSGLTLGASTNLVSVNTYNITAINNGGLTASAGAPAVANGLAADVISNDAWTNTTNANVDVVYTIVPVSGAGCVGPAFTVTLTIRPEPVVPFQSGDMACSDVAIDVTLGNSNPFVSAFNITNIDANGLTASAGNPVTGTGFSDDEIEDDAWTNTTGSPVNVIYTVVPISLDGCPGDFFTVTVQIKPEPAGMDANIPNICSDEALNFDLLGHVPGAAEFTYTVASSDPVGVPPAADRAMASSANITDTYTNLTTDEVTITYTVTPISSDGCVGETFTVTVIIEAEPVVANQTATVCSDANINVTLNDDVDGPFASFYNVTSLSAMGLTPNPGNAVLPSSMFPVQFSSNTELANDQYTNLTNGPLDVVYTIVPLSDDGCEGDPFTVTVTISPEPVVANVSSTNICSDDPIGYVLPATDDDGLSITKYDITASVDMDLIGTATTGSGITDINAIAGDSYTNLQATGRTVVYTIIPYAGDCAGAPFTVTFNIRAEPVLAPNLNTMVCSDAQTGVILSLDSNNGFQTATGYNLISVTPDGGLVAAVGNATPGNNLPASAIASDVWTNTTTSTLNVVYRVAPRRSAGCLGDEVDITVMIKPEPAISNVTATAVCSDTPTGFTLPNDPDGPAAASYIITNINTNGLTASAGNPPIVFPTGSVTNAEIADDAWTNNGGATVNVVYTIVPVSLLDGCKGDPFTVTVPVQAEPIVLAQTKTICSDESVDLLLGNSVLPPSVSFYQITAINPNGLTPGAGNVMPGNGLFNTAIQNDIWTNTTNAPVDVVYLVIPYGSNGCTGNFFSVTITVNPEPVVAPTQSSTVCSDSPTNVQFLGSLNGVPAVTYTITGLTVSPGLTPDPGNLDLSMLPVSGLTDVAISADSYNNVTNGDLTAVYTVVPVSGDGCEGNPYTVTVTVKPEPVVTDLTDGVCSDVAIGTVLPDLDDDGLDITTYDITAIAAMGLTGTPTTSSGITDINEIAGDMFNNPTSGPLDVVYTVTPYADGCAGTPFTITVTISPEPLFNNVSTINVCSDDALGYTLPANSTNSLPLTTFDISAVVQNGLTGTATTGTGLSSLNAIAGDVFTNLTNGGRTVVYTVTPYSNGCKGADFTITFNIRAEPVLNPNLNTMVCSDEPVGVTLAIDNTTGFQTVTGYDLILVTPDAGLVGAMSNAVPGTNLSASAIAADVWTNTTTDTLNVVYRVAPRRNFGCLGDEVDIIVMIKPEPAISNVTAPAVCSDTPSGFTLPDDVNGPAAATYNISAINPNGLSASLGNPIVANMVTAAEIADDAWTNATNATVNVIYTIVPVSADGCEGDPFTVTVPIQPEPNVMFQMATVCSDQALGLTLNDDPDGPSVALYNITNINSNGLMASAGSPAVANAQANNVLADDAWTNTSAMPVNVIYTIVPVGSNGCLGNPFAVTITVNPEPVVAPTQSSTVCSDSPTNVQFLGSLNGVPAVTYTITGLTVSPGLTPDPGNLDLSMLPVSGLMDLAISADSYNNVTNGDLTAVYTVVPVSGDGCEGDPYTVTVTVKPEPVVADLTDGACSDEVIGVVLPALDDDGLAITTYDVSAMVAPMLSGSASTAMGTSDVNLIADDEFTNTTNGPLDVVYTVTPYADGCVGTPFTITVTISPEPVLVNIPVSPICSGEPISFVLPATDNDGLPLTTYDITATVHPDLTGTATTGMGLTNVNAIFNDAFTNLTNTARQVVYTITPYANGCVGTPFTVAFNIRPEPVMADRDGMACSDVAIGYVLPNMDDDGLNLTNADISAVVELGLTGTASTGTGITNVNFIAGDVFTNTTSGPLDVVYTFTPYRLGCAGEPFTITITIKPEPVISSVVAPAVCSDAPTGFTLPDDMDGPAAATYNITNINPNGLSFSAGAPTTGTGFLAGEIANDAWTNATNSTVNVIYTVVPVSADGCQGNPFTVTVPIQPEPIVAFQTKTVCSDEALNLLLGNSLNSTAIAFYQITSITPNGLIAGMSNATVGNGLPNTAIQNDTWTNTGTMPVNVNYVVIPWGSNGCQGNPFGVTITVNPEPVVADQTDMECSDTPIAITLGASTSVAAATYNITNINSNGLTASTGMPVTGTGFADSEIADDAWTNTTNASVDVVYTVVPVSAAGCQGNSFTVTVTIKPEPVVADQTDGACSDVAIGTTLGASSSVAVATYTITNIDPNGLTPGIGNAMAGSGYDDDVIENDIWTNTTTDPVDVVYTVVPVSADGCEGDPFTVTVTISAEPDVADQTATVCSDEAIGVILNDDLDGPAVTSYSITVTNDGGLTASVGPTTGMGLAADAIESDAWTNTGTLPVDVEYTIVPTAGGCEGDPFTVTVTINPEPVVAAQSGMACSDATIGITLGASTSVAAATYNITNINSNGLTASAGSPATGTGFADSEIANDAWTNTTGATVNVVYTVVPVSAAGCEGDAFTVTVMIKSEPVVANQAQAVCSDVPTGLTLGASTNSTAAATYNITNIVNNGMIATAGAPMTGTGFAANIIVDDAWRNQTISPVNVVYTVVPVSAEGCEGNPFTVTITVSPEPVLNVPGAPIALCSDATLGSVWPGISSTNAQPLGHINVTSVTFSSMSPNFIPNPGNAAFPANAVPVSYFDNDSYTNLTGGGVTVSYTVVGVTPGGCASDPVVYEFQIRAEPVLNPNLDKTICSGGNTNITLSLDPTIGFQTPNGFQITAINAQTGLIGGMSNVAANTILTSPYLLDDTWTNNTDGPLTVTYSIRPRRANGCFGDVADVVVTVEPTPVASLDVTQNASTYNVNAVDNPVGIPYQLMLCSGETLNAVGVSTVVPTSGSELWVQVKLTDPDNVLNYGASATFHVPYGQLIFNQAIVNTTNASYVISAVITPYVETDPIGSPTLDPEDCEGLAFELEITIKPEPVAVTMPSLTETCDDGSFTVGLNTNGSSVAAAQYKVTTSVSNPGLTQTSGNVTIGGTVMLAGPTNTISGTFSNATTSTQTVTYTIVPVSADGCEGNAVVVEIDVWARPSVAPTPEAICRGTIAVIDPGVTLGSAAIMSYKWTYIGTTASNFRINGGVLLNPLSPTGIMYTTTTLSINTSSPLATTGLIGFELVVTDANGCVSEPVEVYIEVKPVPNPGTNGSFGPVCETFGNVNLFSLLGGTPQPGGTWTAGMSNPAGGNLIGPNFNPAGSVGGVYTFTYTIDNGACTPQSATVTVTVEPNANAGTFNITADNDVCAGEPSFNLFNLLNTNSYDPGGAWSELTSSGAGLNPATGELDLSTALPGNYTFRYLVTVGMTSCPNPTDFEDVILNIIAPPAANPILGNNMPCINSTANYALTAPNNAGVTYAWSLSGGGTITSPLNGNTATVNWGSTPGTYTLTLIETRLGCETVNELMVTLQAAQADFTYNSISMDGFTIAFTDASTGGAFSWNWTFGDSGSSNSQNPNHTYVNPGTYTVCLSIVGTCGASLYCEDITVPYNPQTVCDNINLVQGYNLISFDAHPSNTDVSSVFAPLINAGILQSVSTYDLGPLLFDPNLPPIFNDLTNIEDGFGYYVQVSQAAMLQVCGTPIDPNFKKDLDAGWNLTAYIPQASQAVDVYFDPLIQANNLVYASAFINNAPLLFDPNLPPIFNDLQFVENGYGYGVFVNNAVLGGNWLLEDGGVEIRGGNTNEVGMALTSVYDFFMGQSNIINPAPGEKVYISTKTGKRVAAFTIIPGGYLLTTAVFGDEPGTTEIDGLFNGDELIFTYKDEVIDIGTRFDGSMKKVWVDLEFSSAKGSDETDSNSEKMEISVFPNPAKEEISIEFVLEEAVEEVSLVIYDMTGKVAMRVRFDGIEGVKNQKTLDISHLNAGSYFVLLQQGNSQLSKGKMIQIIR